MNIQFRNASGPVANVSVDTVEQVWRAIEHELGVLADDRGVEPYGLTIDVDGGARRENKPGEDSSDVHVEAFSRLPDGRVTEYRQEIPREKLSQRVDPTAEVWRQVRLTIVKLQKQLEFNAATMTLCVSSALKQ